MTHTVVCSIKIHLILSASSYAERRVADRLYSRLFDFTVRRNTPHFVSSRQRIRRNLKSELYTHMMPSFHQLIREIRCRFYLIISIDGELLFEMT
jgi:hypothetical protein